MAQRKLTDPTELTGTELPELTAQQRLFVRGILDGMTASDAYRAAYRCEGSKQNTIWCEASKLTKHPAVAQWISAARQAGLGQVKFSIEQHLRRLDRLEELCIISGNLGAAVQAEQLIGKVSGHYVERFEDITDPNPLATLERIAATSPDLARQLAEEHGIPWEVETQH